MTLPLPQLVGECAQVLSTKFGLIRRAFSGWNRQPFQSVAHSSRLQSHKLGAPLLACTVCCLQLAWGMSFLPGRLLQSRGFCSACWS